MNYVDAVAALERRSNYERSGRLTSPTLERIETLVDLLAHPQRGYQVIHITGTVGKTTTARAASEVLRAAGLAVGTYTSPHVESVRERFAYDGREITEDEFADAWEELTPYLELLDPKGEQPITWFEATTALAFSWFAERAVDVAVIEVGMGGTWDATNVVESSVAVFTPIGVDHADVLGAIPTEIATEKVGIIKPGAIVYTAAQDQDVADVLRARSAELGAEIRAEGLSFGVEEARLALGGQQVTARLGHDRYPNLFLPMFGEHTARDAVLGAAAARALLGESALEHEVLAEAFGALHLPGRMEVMQRNPMVVLDGAHNAPSAVALAEAMPDSFTWDRLLLVVGVMADKDVEAVVGPLAAIADEVIATASSSPRAADPEDVALAARAAGGDPIVAPDVAGALSRALERATERDCVLVTGSIYVVGEARERFADLPR